MTYPSYNEIKDVIVIVIQQYGGSVEAKIAIGAITKYFPQLTAQDLQKKDPSGQRT